MGLVGISFNTLSLFGLVLAIGIVVDDAIVVVENVERYLREGLSPKEAAHKTMDEVGGALVAIALVLCAVFIPTAFITGLQGSFYRQFAVTIAASTAISAFVSLTLSPALAALLLKPHKAHDPDEKRGIGYWLMWPINAFFRGFNAGFDWLSNAYGAFTSRMIRISVIVLVAYGGLIGLTYVQLRAVPTGLIPQLDRGYFITAFQLPPGSSLERTDAVVRRASDIIQSRPGVKDAIAFVGLDGATFTNSPNAGVIFVGLKDFKERQKDKLTTAGILADLRQQMFAIGESFTLVIEPPAVPGIGTAVASRATCRTAADGASRRWKARPGSSPARLRRRPASCRPSRCIRRARHRSTPISTGRNPNARRADRPHLRDADDLHGLVLRQ